MKTTRYFEEQVLRKRPYLSRQKFYEGKLMKFHYYPETDSLYIELVDKPGADVREVMSGVVLDFDEEGQLVGIDIDRASTFVDLSRLEAEGLPITGLSLSRTRS